MMKRLLIELTVLVLAGCGVQHQNVRLNLPALHVNQPDAKPIVISDITDSRQSPEGSKLGISERSHNVGGVWRGGNGIAVDLDGDTVVGQSRQIVIQALRGMGYKVVVDSEAAPDVPRVVVNITQFDTSMPFNFWQAATYSQHMFADISTDITVKSGDSVQTFKASGHGENVFQRVIPENWEIALNKAIVDYTRQLQMKMIVIE